MIREVARRALRVAVTAAVCLSAQFTMPVAHAATPSATIWTDATGPLIGPARLTPGGLPAACVAVSWADLASLDIGLHVSASGALGSYLSVRIDVGTGGHYGDCTGFSGSPVFDGTLAQLAAMHGSSTTAISVVPPSPVSGTLTYRFSFALVNDDAAQGLTASAGFTWSVLGVSSPIVVPPPSSSPTTAPGPTVTPRPAPTISTPTPRPTRTPSAPPSSQPATSPTPTPSTEPASPRPTTTPGTTPTPSPSTSAQPSPTSTASVPAGGPGTPTSSRSPVASPRATPSGTSPPRPSPATSAPRPGGRPDRPGTSTTVPLTGGSPKPPNDGFSIGSLVPDVVVAAGAQVAKHSAFPIGLLVFVLLYLAVQDRWDRKDPKLALAPLYADPKLPFPADGDWSDS